MNTYKTGDIVIIDTGYLNYGKIVAPAVIRFYDEVSHLYAVNALLIGVARLRATEDNLHWLAVSEKEIRGKVGEALVEKGLE